MPQDAAAALATIWARVDRSDPDACWTWPGSVGSHGYGQIKVDDRPRLVHVIVFEDAYGPVPPGREVDHTCHNRMVECAGGRGCLHRRCCNHRHLEAVLPGDNRARADALRLRGAAKQECPHGHPLDGVVQRRTGSRAGAIHRYCKQCNRDNQARRKG